VIYLQRYYSFEEYEAMGYQLRQDVRFDEGSYSSFGVGSAVGDFIDFPAYRADTKEDAYVDFAYAGFKIGAAFLTGGTSAMATAAIGQLAMLFSD